MTKKRSHVDENSGVNLLRFSNETLSTRVRNKICFLKILVGNIKNTAVSFVTRNDRRPNADFNPSVSGIRFPADAFVVLTNSPSPPGAGGILPFIFLSVQ